MIKILCQAAFDNCCFRHLVIVRMICLNTCSRGLIIQRWIFLGHVGGMGPWNNHWMHVRSQSWIIYMI